MALKQKNRFLTIDTILGNPEGEDEDDNFVLLQLRGAEGISFPYAFDLTMIGPKGRRPEPSRLIGSRARVGIKHVINEADQDVFDHVHRHGVIETFGEVGPLGDFRCYTARLVPAFKLTAYETRFRVFEEQTLETVLRSVLAPYTEIELNANVLRDEAPNPIPYCAQFGESTLNFVHRLLDRFGIFYRFEHELNAQREVLALGGRSSVRPSNVGVVDIGTGDPGPGRVTSFRKSFALATRKVKIGNFNEINPATPFRGEADIAPGYDLMGDHPAHEAEAFPAPVTVAPEPRDHAERRMRQNEGGVFAASGLSKNTQFRAGRTFIVHEDATAPPDSADKGETGKTWFLKTVTLFAFDHSALVSTGGKLFDLIKGLFGLGSTSKDDASAAAAQALLDQIKKDVETGKEIFAWLDKAPGANNPSGLPDFVGSLLGRGGSAVAGAVPLIVATAKSIKDLLEKFFADPSGFSCAFDALPFDSPFLRDVLPTPPASRPLAYGPHLALVIGPDGIDNAARDIFTDALGRVRIRFPWDPGPDNPNDPIGKEPILTGRNTCFVRVSDGWAGERLGLQFIPRIGQEVVVGFIDGDPERPMVVGRAYNARGGTSHLPFLPASAQGKQLVKPADLKGTETDQATRSGIRSKTTPRKPEGQSGFHMLRLEDKQGEEQFLIRSERRMDQTAFGSRFDTTRGNLHLLVGGGKQEEGKPPPGGSFFTTAGGEVDLHVGKDQFENIDSEINLTVKGNKIQDIGNGFFAYAGERIALNGDTIVLQAKRKITLRVGSAQIVITPSCVYCDGAFYKEQQGGQADDLPEVELTDAADAAQADPGEPPDFLARLPKGGGGPRRKHTKSPKEAPFLVPDPKTPGRIIVTHKGDPEGKESNLKIDSRSSEFTDRVANDLIDMSETPDGRRRINNAAGGSNPTVIKEPDTLTDPPTATTKPDSIPDSTAAGEPTGRIDKDGNLERGTGKGSGSTVTYDPVDWPREGDPNSPKSTDKLGDLLDEADANQNGQGKAGRFGGQVPPSPPPAPGSGSGPAGGAAPASGAGGAPASGGGAAPASGGGAAP
ncbi:hypothetical protein GXW74_03910, partial [Roseomonas eburnea]